MEILKHVDILDLIRVHVLPERFYDRHTGKFTVLLESVDPHKQVVIDEKASATLNEEVVKRASTFEARDPRAAKFIEEFVSRMVSELYRNGLVVLEDVQDAPSDPYQAAKEQIQMHSRRR